MEAWTHLSVTQFAWVPRVCDGRCCSFNAATLSLIDVFVAVLWLPGHFVVIALDVRAMTLHYYDSIVDAAYWYKWQHTVAALRLWFEAITAALGLPRVDTSTWPLAVHTEMEGVPQQRGPAGDAGVDCAIVAIGFARAIAEGRA